MTSRVYFDTELRGPDLTVIGTLNYVLDPRTELLLMSYMLDEDPLVKLWVPDLSKRLHPKVWAFVKSRTHYQGALPAEVLSAAANPGCFWVAWNAAFDRAVLSNIGPEYGFPDMGIGKFLDAQAQAQASNLPGGLDMAGRALKLGEKTVGGKAIMKRFADPDLPLPGAPELCITEAGIKTALEQWDLYLTYGDQDTGLMKQIWDVTRPLDDVEWEEYWAHERINDRGMAVDLEFCAAAVKYKDEEEAWVIERCKELTNGAIQGPTFSAKITAWVYERLPDALVPLMVKTWKDVLVDGKVAGQEPDKLTLDKNTIKRLLEDVAQMDFRLDGEIDDNVVEFLELLEFGRSTSASKFQKILDQAVPSDDPDEPARLTYSYVFNGAGQTGRYSSRGVQIHNLPNKAMLNELDVMDMIVGHAPIEELRKLPLDKDTAAKWAKSNMPPTPTSVSAILARLIRPTFIAPKNKMIISCDWSAIEARVTPWLADTQDAEEKVLDIFRATDKDKSLPDIYVYNAASIFGVPAEDMWAAYQNGEPQGKAWRQGGKIAVLSLGFLGGEGALKAMGRGYGMRFAGDEASMIVDGWRNRNKWARAFGNKAEAAAFTAMKNPGVEVKAGRLRYGFYPTLMAGSLVCTLPCGRLLMYPMARIVKIEKFGKEVDAITYLNGNGRSSTWSGKLIENGTQAYAASLLRGTLLAIDKEWADEIDNGEVKTVGDTHDEILLECDEDKVEYYEAKLHALMVRGFTHSAGLPLAAEAEADWYYHK